MGRFYGGLPPRSFDGYTTLTFSIMVWLIALLVLPCTFAPSDLTVTRLALLYFSQNSLLLHHADMQCVMCRVAFIAWRILVRRAIRLWPTAASWTWLRLASMFLRPQALMRSRLASERTSPPPQPLHTCTLQVCPLTACRLDNLRQLIFRLQGARSLRCFVFAQMHDRQCWPAAALLLQ